MLLTVDCLTGGRGLVLIASEVIYGIEDLIYPFFSILKSPLLGGVLFGMWPVKT